MPAEVTGHHDLHLLARVLHHLYDPFQLADSIHHAVLRCRQRLPKQYAIPGVCRYPRDTHTVLPAVDETRHVSLRLRWSGLCRCFALRRNYYGHRDAMVLHRSMG